MFAMMKSGPRKKIVNIWALVVPDVFHDDGWSWEKTGEYWAVVVLDGCDGVGWSPEENLWIVTVEGFDFPW